MTTILYDDRNDEPRDVEELEAELYAAFDDLYQAWCDAGAVWTSSAGYVDLMTLADVEYEFQRYRRIRERIKRAADGESAGPRSLDLQGGAS